MQLLSRQMRIGYSVAYGKRSYSRNGVKDVHASLVTHARSAGIYQKQCVVQHDVRQHTIDLLYKIRDVGHSASRTKEFQLNLA